MIGRNISHGRTQTSTELVGEGEIISTRTNTDEHGFLMGIGEGGGMMTEVIK
ncbi:MAG: hypothetical protein V1888_03490 [archaeon]